MREGDRMDVVAVEGDGWVKVRHNGREGIVPEAYVELR